MTILEKTTQNKLTERESHWISTVSPKDSTADSNNPMTPDSHPRSPRNTYYSPEDAANDHSPTPKIPSEATPNGSNKILNGTHHPHPPTTPSTDELYKAHHLRTRNHTPEEAS
jgi:hypothetical protein